MVGFTMRRANITSEKRHNFYVTFLFLRAILKADARCFTFLVEEQQKIREKRKRNLQQSSQTSLFHSRKCERAFAI